MNLIVGAAVLFLLAWVVLVFVVAVPSGWVHLSLAIGCVLMAVGLVGKRAR